MSARAAALEGELDFHRRCYATHVEYADGLFAAAAQAHADYEAGLRAAAAEPLSAILTCGLAIPWR